MTTEFGPVGNIVVRDNVATGASDLTITTPREALVPEWAPEDEARLKANVMRLAAETPQLVRVEKPPTAVTFLVDLAIERLHRATCPECRHRRVLYAIVVGGLAFGASEPRCARCWDIR